MSPITPERITSLIVLRRRREAVVEADVDAPPGPPLRIEDAPAHLGRRRHRLFGDDVDARLERGDDEVGMRVVARADDERLRLGRGEHLAGDR